MKIISTLSAYAVLAFFPSLTYASGVIVPGGPSVFDGSVTIAADAVSPPDPATEETSFSTNLEADRSYACTLTGESNQSNVDIRAISGPGSVSVPLVLIGNVSPAVTGDIGDTNNNRVSISPNGTTQVTGNYSISIANATTSGGTSASTKARFDCLETTLYGGYNTNVNDFNFLEITNTTNATIIGAITATNSDGTVVINKQAFGVLPNRRVDVDLHTPAGRNKFGLIQVTHSGPYGALQAYVSQYDGTISNFVQTASIPLRPRDK